MILQDGTMNDVLRIAILVASFALVIGLIQVISRMLERGTHRANPHAFEETALVTCCCTEAVL